MADDDPWCLSPPTPDAAESEQDQGELPDVVPQRRGPGRPRNPLLHAFRCEESVEAGAIVRVRPNDVDPLLGPRANVGAAIHRTIARAVHAVGPADVHEQTQKMILHFLGVSPKAVVPSGAEARMLDAPERSLRRNMIELASAAFFGCRAWIGSLLSRLLAEIERGALVAVSTFVVGLYDETPLVMRGPPGCSGGARWNPEAEGTLVSLPQENTIVVSQRSDKGVCKLVQGECTLAVLLQCAGGGQHFLMVMPCALPLHWVDRTTGETLKVALEEQSGFVNLDRLRAKCIHNFDLSIADRATSNDRVEDALYQARPEVSRMRLPCVIHMCSTAQGRSFGSIGSDVAGIVAGAIVQQPAGAPASFRACIAEVLEASVRQCDAARPPADHRRAVHRDALLSLVLPDTKAGRARAAELRLLFTGNLESDHIDVHIPGQALDVKAWALRLSHALLRRSVGVFARHRWCNSLACLSEFALLSGVHDILFRAGQRWLAISAGKPAPVILVREESDVAVGEADAWELSQSEDASASQNDGEPADAIVAALDAGAAPGAAAVEAEGAAGSDWAAFNSKMRNRAMKFFASDPKHRLVLGRLTLQLLVRLLHSLEKVGGEKYDRKQWANCIRDGHCRTRMWEAFSGDLQAPMFAEACELAGSEERWAALAPAGRTLGHAGLAFSMISSALCGAEQFILRVWRTFPYRLFALVDLPREEVARAILNSPRCLRDEWSDRFLSMFPTVDELLSARARAILASMGSLLRWDISRLECRHASVRGFMKVATTHAAGVSEVSASFFLQQQRLLERKFAPAASRVQLAKAKACRKRRTGRYRGARTGGGGAQRRFLSTFLSGRRYWTRRSEECSRRAMLLSWLCSAEVAKSGRGL